MKTTRTTSAIAVGAFLLAVSLGACSARDGAGSTPETTAASSSAIEALESQLAALGISDNYDVSILTQEEIDGLVFMREEEKLAHDVYVTLYDQWELAIFDNISQSETTHTNAVADLLESYGIDDPAAGNGVGEFTDPELQYAYDELVSRGAESLVAALEVGAYIEEMDILDLRERESTTPAIDNLYDQLERGSRNHLRAFVKNLERQGVDYEPQLMEVDDFEAIISTPTEQGNGDGLGTGEGKNDGQGNGNGNGNGRGRA
ncbi:MAG: DUF2202 domain-containing protein [Acidimicrobiia bacterium]|nr:DUF2202 domain-containing protein [Acidimicrobiia bacterium]